MNTDIQNCSSDLEAYWNLLKVETNEALEDALPTEKTTPSTIHRAMRYSVFAGGKRLRPILALATAEALNAPRSLAYPAACAVECMHTYSLIHDDLPAMDNDDLRRGRPTNHKVFGESIAILAGDALLNEAFAIISKTQETTRYKTRHFVAELAFAGNSKNLIGGQIMDLEAEGKAITQKQLAQIHHSKTAALLTTALRLGAMVADTSADQLTLITQYGRDLGQAFQVIDDILDVTSDSATLGKTAGKDLTSDKSTYPALLGLNGAIEEAKRLTQNAHKTLGELNGNMERLTQITDYLLNREF